jgi:phosphoribosylglycinamide formyltransferase-1
LKSEGWPARIAAVISNKPEAKGLDLPRPAASRPPWCRKQGVCHPRRVRCSALQETIDRFAPDLVVLAGFMRILTAPFRRALCWAHAEHPPVAAAAVPGAGHAPAGARRRRKREHGATVHFVTAELDHGPIVAQARVPVLPGDTEDTLSARLLVEEHKLYPHAVRLFVEDRLSIEQGDVRMLDARVPAPPAFNQHISSISLSQGIS